MKPYLRFFLVAGLMGLFVLSLIDLEEFGEIDLSLNGVACNHTSMDVWLTLTERGRQRAYALHPGNCTDAFGQDAEAIWGKACSGASCSYQAWKLGAGRFDLYADADSAASFILRIRGWGAGSRWHITREWPRPDLSAISYSLVR